MRPALAALLALAPLASAPADDFEVVGRLEHPHLTETSGIAASTSMPGIIWGINDSGNAAELYAFDAQGTHRGRVRIANVHNRDWEDLAAFVVDGRSYLLIADTGDNEARRQASFIFVLEEPAADDHGLFGGKVEVIHRIPFRFEDGAQDCEAVAVDVAGGRILLIAKRRVPAPVYELPLPRPTQRRSAPLTARRIGTLGGLARLTPQEMLSAPLGPWRHQPTALDISADGTLAVVGSYQNLYVYRRSSEQSWSEALAQPQRILRLPLSQIEAIALVGDRVVAVAEGRLAPVLWSPPLTD